MAGRPHTIFSLNIGEFDVDESVDLLLKDERVLPKVKIFSDKLNTKIASLASDEEDSEPSLASDEEDSEHKLNKIFSIMATLEQRDLVYIFTTLFENLHGQVAALFTCFTLLTVSLQCELFKLYGKVFSETLLDTTRTPWKHIQK